MTGVRLHPLGPAVERPAKPGSRSSNSSTTRRASVLKRPAHPTTARGSLSWATRRCSHGEPGLRPRNGLWLLDTRTGSRGAGVRERDGQALRPSSPSRRCSNHSASSTGGFSITTADRSSDGILRTAWACRPVTWRASLTACRTEVAGRPAGDPRLVRRPDRRADPRRAGTRDALPHSTPRRFLDGWELSAPDRRRRAQWSRHSRRRPLETRLRRPTDRLRAEPRSGGHSPDRWQRRLGVRGVSSPGLRGGQRRPMSRGSDLVPTA